MKNLIIKEFGHDKYSTALDELTSNFDALHKSIGFIKDISFTRAYRDMYCRCIKNTGLLFFINDMKVSGKRTTVEVLTMDLFKDLDKVRTQDQQLVAKQIDYKAVEKIHVDQIKKTLNIFLKDNVILIFKYSPQGFKALCDILVYQIALYKRRLSFTPKHIKSGTVSFEDFLKRVYVEDNFSLYVHKNAENSSLCNTISTFLKTVEKVKTPKTVKEQKPVVQTEQPVDQAPEVKEVAVIKPEQEEITTQLDDKAFIDKALNDSLNATYLELLDEELRAKAEFLNKFEAYLDVKAKRLKVRSKVIDDGK
jgi:hypothetical protein